MNDSTLTAIQKEILKALQQLGDKTRYPETILAKKIRENAKLDSKKKAVIALNDLEKVLSVLEEDGTFYAVHLNSANDLLLEKAEASVPLSADAHHRRQTAEKSMTIFTDRDLKSATKNSGKGDPHHNAKRSDRKKINIHSNFEDLDE